MELTQPSPVPASAAKDGNLPARPRVPWARRTKGRVMRKSLVTLIAVAVLTMDRYYPGIMAVCFTDRTPKHAVEDIDRRQ